MIFVVVHTAELFRSRARFEGTNSWNRPMASLIAKTANGGNTGKLHAHSCRRFTLWICSSSIVSVEQMTKGNKIASNLCLFVQILHLYFKVLKVWRFII